MSNVSRDGSRFSASLDHASDNWRDVIAISRADSMEAAADALATCLKAFGVDGFGFGAIWRDGDGVAGARCCARGVMESLVADYLDRRLENRDPLLRALLRGRRAALWSQYYFGSDRADGDGASAEIAALFHEHGVTAGATISLNDFGGAYRAVMSLAATRTDPACFDAEFVKHECALRAAGVIFCDVALREGLPRLEPGDLVLSNSEKLVMEGLVRGMRARDIASWLGKSEHTVRNQIASAQARLGARTKEQAIAVALRRGLIGL
ncbi:MAG: hypothetical protein EA355_10540 [Rhodobacteraceae bacterium]|nr:MAG: hypothetical protein EA355_10540 [Paracoccaceae bacterium]